VVIPEEVLVHTSCRITEHLLIGTDTIIGVLGGITILILGKVATEIGIEAR